MLTSEMHATRADVNNNNFKFIVVRCRLTKLLMTFKINVFFLYTLVCWCFVICFHKHVFIVFITFLLFIRRVVLYVTVCIIFTNVRALGTRKNLNCFDVLVRRNFFEPEFMGCLEFFTHY